MPRCGFDHREAPESACWSSFEGVGSGPSGPAAEVGPVIDAPMIVAIPPSLTADGVEEGSHHDGLGGWGTKYRTLSGTIAQRARTPTPLISWWVRPGKMTLKLLRGPTERLLELAVCIHLCT